MINLPKQLTCTIVALVLCAGQVSAFAPATAACRRDTSLSFGIPSWLTPSNAEDDKDEKTMKNKNNSEKEEKKIGMSGLIQLITAGAGSPFLGDFEGVDPETGKFMFSLEANNLVDEQGNSKQTQMPYFESGWVDPEDEQRAKENKWWPF